MLVVAGFVIWVIQSTRQSVKQELTEARLGVRNHLLETIEAAPISDVQKAECRYQVERLYQAACDARITLEDLRRAREALVDSHVFALALFWYVDRRVAQPSIHLSETEKQDSELQVQRFMRGVLEGRISAASAESARELITAFDETGRRRLKHDLSRFELLDLIAYWRSAADAAEIADDPFDLNVVERVRTTVDRILDSPAEPSP